MEATIARQSWPPALAQAAVDRAERIDWRGTACWRYAPLGPSSGRVLMVHGFRGDHHGLEAIVGALPNFEVWVPDLPGYGKSADLTGRHDLSGYGEWLLSLIEWLRPDALIGHSFGTQIIACASKSLSTDLKVVLINPIVVSSITQSDLANRVARTSYRLAAKLGAVGGSLLRGWFVVRIMSIAMCKTRNFRLRAWVHQQHHRYFSGYRSDRVAHEGFWAAAMGSVANDWQFGAADRVTVIAGELDSIAPIGRVSEFSNRVGAKLKVLPETGHLVHYEVPALVGRAIQEALG